jgi:peptidoglycan/xylan/chitin deacetylase (PgdA/CDA1 family)
VATGWKRAVERLASSSGLARALATLRAPSTTILAYHNIVPTGEPLAGDVSLHVDQAAFARQLDFLLEWTDVVPLEAIEQPSNKSMGAGGRRPRVVITFDDAYRGTMSAGVQELRARNLSATVFVPPGLLGQGSFWWDALAPAGGAPLAPEARAHALGPLAGRQADILEWADARRMPLAQLPEHARPADEATLQAGAGYEGLALGAHTWSHPNLAALAANEARDELQRSRTWLAARAPRYVDWLAYPYGLRTDETVALASEHFRGALLISGGLARTRGRDAGPRHALPRVNIPRGLTLEGLALRLAGLLG